MIVGYMLVIGGGVQLLVGWRSDVEALTLVGAIWVVAGLATIAMSTVARRGHAKVRPGDMENPAARARLYQGVRGQLTRGMIALACSIASIVVAISGVSFDAAWPIAPFLCGGFVGFLTLLGLLIYAVSSAERSAVLPATVVVLGYKQLPLRGGNGQPYIRMVLDIYPEGGTRYESTIQTLVPELALAHLAVGSQFRARVAGPRKPTAVFIDFSAATESAGSASASAGAASASAGLASASAGAVATPPPARDAVAPADRLRELDGLRTQGLVTDAEYQEQRSRILDSL